MQSDGAPLDATTPAITDAKLIATLKAEAALCGVVLHTGVDDFGRPSFIATKWTLTRELHSADEVRELLRQIGGQQRA